MKFPSFLMTVILLVGCGARSSDEEQVRTLVAQLETAAEERDTGDVLARIADDYQDAQGFDRAQLANFLRGYFLMHSTIELFVDISRLEFPAEGLAQADITVTRVSLSDPDQLQLKVEFRRQEGDWQVSRADRLRP